MTGHYIKKMDTSGHYCEKPSVFYSCPGEVWQCDECGHVWKFKRTLTAWLGLMAGEWR